MVGHVVRVDPGPERAGVKADIAGHDEPIGELHDQRRIVEAAIGIDQKPREARQDRGCAERLGQSLGHAGGAKVIGNVAMEVLFLQAEATVNRWDRVFGMVAEDEKARACVAFDAAVGLKAQIVLWKRVQTSLRDGQTGRRHLLARPLPGRQEKILIPAPVATQLFTNFGGSFAAARLYNRGAGQRNATISVLTFDIL